MRVLFLQRQPCIRALKYAVGLRSALPDLTLGFAYQGRTLTEWYGTGDELFDEWWQIGHPVAAAELREVVAEFRPDVIHSHNLPDGLTVAALALGPGRPPVVHDAHDMQSLRRTPYEDGFADESDPLVEERAAVEGADALLAVSTEMMDEMAARYRLPRLRAQFPNLVLSRDLPDPAPLPDRPRRGPRRIVYEGTLSANGSHYDLRDLFSSAAAQGLQIDVIPNRDVPEYEDLARRTPGLSVLAKRSPQEVMTALPEYDFGWAIFNSTLNGRHLDTCLPNKAYEYLGAGLPIIAGDHRALRRLIESTGVGLVAPSIDGLREQVEAADVAALRRHVSAVAGTITVEGAIGRVIELYRAAAAVRGRTNGPPITRSIGPPAAQTLSPHQTKATLGAR